MASGGGALALPGTPGAAGVHRGRGPTAPTVMKAGRFHSCFVMSHGRQPTPNNNRC